MKWTQPQFNLDKGELITYQLNMKATAIYYGNYYFSETDTQKNTSRIKLNFKWNEKRINAYIISFLLLNCETCSSLFCIHEIFGYDIHATVFLNVQKSLKINIQWTKKRGFKGSVFERSKLTVHIVHYEHCLNAIYTLIFLLSFLILPFFNLFIVFWTFFFTFFVHWLYLWSNSYRMSKVHI